MPPSIPQSSLSCLTRCSASSKTAVSPYARTFTTSSQLLSIGPESPKFIKVPQPPQRFPKPEPVIRGTLPVPRNVFHRRIPNKANEKWLSKAVPEPAPREEPIKEERVMWKSKLAESRRTALREGIYELQKRKIRTKQQQDVLSKKKLAIREKLVNAPQRLDEYLMSPTVREAVSKPQRGKVPDPNRVVRINRMKKNVARMEHEKELRRKNALHTLYMNAREFITTEDELNKEIDHIFTDRPFGNTHHTNIWDAYGKPITVGEMLQSLSGSSKKALQNYKKPHTIAGERMKTIAEELTGGTMDI